MLKSNFLCLAFIIYFLSGIIYAQTTYTVTVNKNFPINTATQSGSGTYSAGSQVTLSATPASGYYFENWASYPGDIVITNPTYTFTVDKNIWWTANFHANPGTLRIQTYSYPTEGGTITDYGTDRFPIGTALTFTATPASGYVFMFWGDNNHNWMAGSGNPTYSYTPSSGDQKFYAHFNTKPTYTLTTLSDPPDAGTITGGGEYAPSAYATITATPALGLYTFTNFTFSTPNGGPYTSPYDNLSINVIDNITVTAHFTPVDPNKRTITITSNPEEGGTTTGSGLHTFLTDVLVTATPAVGYSFLNWTENGNVVSTSANYSFALNDNRNLTANFVITNYTVTTSSNPSAGGTITQSGSGTYSSGSSVTLTAAPASGYTFTNWTENGTAVSTEANYTFTINSNRTLTANFTLQPTQFTVTTSANPTEGGTVSGGGTYNLGTDITLTATPASGYTFTNWTENGNEVWTNANYSFAVNTNRNLIANFVLTNYTLTTESNPAAGGTVTQSGSGTYSSGSSVTLTAAPASGYTFTNWTENGTVASTEANYIFTINNNRILTANFTSSVTNYTITSTTNPTAGGTVTQSGSGTYSSGSSVTLTATPASGYTFTNWTENSTAVSTEANYTFTVSSNRTLTANFTLSASQFVVTTTSNPTGDGTTSQSGSGTYNSGSSVTLTATPASGYTFTNWTENGTLVSTQANYTFTITSNKTLTANFTTSSSQFTVTAISSSVGEGTTAQNGSGTYNYGSAVTVSAVSQSGYTFSNWMEDDVVVSRDSNYTFSVTKDIALKANFAANNVGWFISGKNIFFNTGNVAIGTSNFETNYKLKVNGTIKAKEINVTVENFPDYVFEDNYSLKTIEQVESYIRENKHLPEIPSAQEIEENGLSIGEMQAKLLQKIEELTLHLIDQNKKIDQLSKRITKLEKQNTNEVKQRK